MTKENNYDHCNHPVVDGIDKASDLIRENKEIAQSFFNKVGWAIILFSLSAGVAAATWGIYFLIK